MPAGLWPLGPRPPRAWLFPCLMGIKAHWRSCEKLEAHRASACLQTVEGCTSASSLRGRGGSSGPVQTEACPSPAPGRWWQSTGGCLPSQPQGVPHGREWCSGSASHLLRLASLRSPHLRWFRPCLRCGLHAALATGGLTQPTGLGCSDIWDPRGTMWGGL